jgi:alpha-D-ribose 1-methylphosphonate 5-triphosphate diphosphatase
VSAGSQWWWVRRTCIASDYLPSGLLAAVFTLVSSTRVSLAAAVALVTSGPADVAGLTDRGRLQPGLRADLALIAAQGRWPVVHSVLVSGR